MAKSKKELDRDSMFEKIMPSLAENPFAVGNRSAASPPAEEDLEDDSLAALKDKLFARSDDSYDTGSVATINLMESLVLQNIDMVIQKFSCCRCDRCRRDIAAYALNLLPPQYVVVDPRRVENLAKEIPSRPVMDALIKAVIRVRANPRH